MNQEEIKKLITEKKNRLTQLKQDGFFKIGDRIRSQKYASLEVQRRRREIKDLENLLNFEHEQNKSLSE